MASAIRRPLAALCPALTALLLAAAPTGCESSGNGETASGSTGAEPTTTTTEADPTTTSVATTTGPATGTTTDVDDTTGADSSSTSGNDDTTTADGSSSGPGCDPGTPDCVCDRGACEGAFECIDDVCLDPAGCQGERMDAEPNDVEGDAIALPDAECGALSASPPGSVELGDVDWYEASTVDLGNECPASDGTIAIVTASEDLEVCMFFACDAGAPSVNCPTDTAVTSDDGLDGCCGVGSVEPDAFCTGIDNNGQMRLRVGGLEAQACIDYELAYRFL